MSNLPAPAGYRLLIALNEIPERTRGGIIIPDATKDAERAAGVTGRVVAMGPDAYTDTDKFPSGPWCKLGDNVLFGKYAGARFKYQDVEHRMLNDDEIMGVVPDPAQVSRI